MLCWIYAANVFSYSIVPFYFFYSFFHSVKCKICCGPFVYFNMCLLCQNLKIKLLCDLVILLLDTYSKNHQTMHSYLHWSTTYNNQYLMQPKHLTTMKWIKALQYICTMDIYSAVARDQTLHFASTWKLSMMLSKLSQKEKDKNKITLFLCGL